MPVRKVLVVDDEDSTRTAVRFILEDAGYEVSEAPNGIVALDLLHAATEPMVVLLDLMMPGMSGLRLLQIVGREPELAARHDFILFTAARAFTAESLALYLPAKHLSAVTKPFDIDQLISAVDHVAGRLRHASAASRAKEIPYGRPGASRTNAMQG